MTGGAKRGRIYPLCAAIILAIALMGGALAAFKLISPLPLSASRHAALVGIPADPIQALERRADCPAGTLVTVVAHLDDDLLFVNPGIARHLSSGWCIVTVHLIGGANGAPFNYVLTRERAIRNAYARMAGVPNRWRETTVMLAGSPVHWMTLETAPRVELVELRLPGGHVRGGPVPLGELWEEGQTIATYPVGVDGSVAHYDRASLVAALGVLLSKASKIFTLNPDAVPFAEHPDHIYAARIVRFAARVSGARAPLRYHLTYVTSMLPANLPSDEIQTKRDAAASYFAIDSGIDDLARVFGENEWNGDWIARRYLLNDEKAKRVAREAGMPGGRASFHLVNAYTLQCVDTSGANARLRLAACDGRPTERWRWLPVPSHPGNAHNAALVNEATGQCAAELDDALVGMACDPDDIAERFTPWDFGIVRTPLEHCLGESAGRLALGPCEAQTSAYRWAPTPYSRWTDSRLAGAMIGDVTAPGKPSAVYVSRRTDGPGFDVWVAPLGPHARTKRWYANAVPFDARVSGLTCGSARLCFDNTRFVLGDFEGIGRADLMAIAPRHGGTAFWLLRNLGDRFDAPRLWYQSAPAFSPERTQQYVAADFTGHGRADVMLAQDRPSHPGAGDEAASEDSLELWVLESRGATGAAPARWMPPPEAAASPGYMPRRSTRFLAARLDDTARAGLFALDDADGALVVTPLESTGGGFSPAQHVRCAPCRAPFAKASAGPMGERTDTLVILTLREPTSKDPATIDAWTMAGGARLRAPEHAGTIASVAWVDALPAFEPRLAAAPSDARSDSSAAALPLILFSRENARMDEYHFTSGAPQLIGYAINHAGHTLSPTELSVTLPGSYSEALRLDRLR